MCCCPARCRRLQDISALRDGDGDPVLLALGSDFDAPAEQYYDIIENLGIRSFFEPVTARVTLSGEVGTHKPAKEFFAAAVTKADPGLDVRGRTVRDREQSPCRGRPDAGHARDSGPPARRKWR